MKDFASYYDVLRISENASGEEIKKAYRKLVLQFHPDRVPPEAPDLKALAEEEFKRIQEAYDVLSVPQKRKQYDEQLKNLKAGQAAGRGGAGSPPVVRVDRNCLQFINLKPGVPASDIFTVYNDGGGALTGTVTADKPWVRLSETIINTSDYQEIEITIDTASLPAGFSDSALVEIDTSGGKETVAIDISLDPDSLGLFSVYLKSLLGPSQARSLTIGLCVLFLIFGLIHSCNSAAVANKTGWQGGLAVIPKPEDFRGEWYGYSSSYQDMVLSLVPKGNRLEGRIVAGGIIGKIKGEIGENGEMVFRIAGYEDVFNDLTGRNVSFLESLAVAFTGRLEGNRIEISAPENFTLSRFNDSSNTCLMKALIYKMAGTNQFKELGALYDADFGTVWEATLKVLEREKEKIRYENREEKIIVTYATEHSSLLGDYVHKYVILFGEERGLTEVIVTQFRYEKGFGSDYLSPASDSTHTTDVYFFIPLEKELRGKTRRADFVIQRLYLRKNFLSRAMDRLSLISLQILYFDTITHYEKETNQVHN